MKERFLRKTVRGSQYIQSTYGGQNLSGIRPIGDSVLLMIDKSVEKSEGGIIIPGEKQERDTIAAETGVIVAVGDGAYTWNADRSRPFTGERPKPGDRAYFTRYAGQEHVGRDGETYRLMTDNCLGGVELPDADETPAKTTSKSERTA